MDFFFVLPNILNNSGGLTFMDFGHFVSFLGGIFDLCMVFQQEAFLVLKIFINILQNTHTHTHIMVNGCC